MYIFLANMSNGANNTRTTKPNSIPLIPLKNVESRTIIDKIIFCTIRCIPGESCLRILYNVIAIINEKNARIIRESYLKNPMSEKMAIEKIIMAIMTGIKNNFIFFGKP